MVGILTGGNGNGCGRGRGNGRCECIDGDTGEEEGEDGCGMHVVFCGGVFWWFGNGEFGVDFIDGRGVGVLRGLGLEFLRWLSECEMVFG